jgi:hypothetical protein
VLEKENVGSKTMKIYNYVSAERRHSGKTVENNYNKMIKMTKVT